HRPHGLAAPREPDAEREIHPAIAEGLGDVLDEPHARRAVAIDFLAERREGADPEPVSQPMDGDVALDVDARSAADARSPHAHALAHAGEAIRDQGGVVTDAAPLRRILAGDDPPIGGHRLRSRATSPWSANGSRWPLRGMGTRARDRSKSSACRRDVPAVGQRFGCISTTIPGRGRPWLSVSTAPRRARTSYPSISMTSQ